MIITGPNIIFDGLVLYVDAANKKSYTPGSGWKDLSKKNNDGAFNGNPPFSTNAIGSFHFDGVDSYTNHGNDTSLQLDSEFSVCFWSKIENFNNSMTFVEKGQGLESSGNYGWAITYSSSSLKMHFDTYESDGTRHDLGASFDSENTSWNYWCFTFNSGNKTIYKNGVLQQSTSSTHTIGDSTTYDLLVGGDSYHLNGYLTNLKIYNKQLSELEILQNFHAHKKRFGINIMSSYDWYGEKFEIGQTSTITSEIGSSELISSEPITSNIYPAVINEDKSINYKLNPNNLTQKENEDSSDLSGADGDVMAVIPTYYRKWWVENGYIYNAFSPTYIPGFTKIPKHARGIYMADEDGSSKLRSRSNVTPLTNKTRNYYRTRASNKGSGWSITPYFIYESDYFLWLTESQKLHSQEAISVGATNASSTNWSNYNGYYPVWKTDGGSASSYGGGTVTASPTNPNTSNVRTGEIPITVSSFDGTTLNTQMAILWWMRDVFGHIWEFWDDINIYNSSANGSQVYISKNPNNFADDISSNYILYANIAQNDGYISQFVNGTILPYLNGVSGNSSNHCGDYHYSRYDNDPNSGWRVALAGGTLNHGTRAGLLLSNFHNDSGNDSPNLGARLCLIF